MTKQVVKSKLSLVPIISVGQRHAGHTQTTSGKFSDPHYQTLGATSTSMSLQQKKYILLTEKKKTQKSTLLDPEPLHPQIQTKTVWPVSQRELYYTKPQEQKNTHWLH